MASNNNTTRTLRKSQRTSKTNLTRHSLSPQKPADLAQQSVKTYELNAEKAIEKKLTNCISEHLRIEEKMKNNLRLYLALLLMNFLEQDYQKCLKFLQQKKDML